MAVSTTKTFSGPYLADGIVSEFPFEFRVLDPADVSMMARDALGYDSPVDRAIFSVTLFDEGGVVTVNDPWALAGFSVFVYSDPSFLQQTEFENGSRWLAEPVNSTNDRAAVRDLALRRGLRSAIRGALGEDLNSLPDAVARAARLLGFDGAGQPTLVPGSAAQLGADLADIIARLLALENRPSPLESHAADWGALPEFERALAEATYNPARTVRIAGIGDSNMLNDNGGLAGANNSPLDVVVRAIRKTMAPLDRVNIVAQNFGVNGSVVNDADAVFDTVKAFNPDLVVTLYVTNSAGIGSYNAGQTFDPEFGFPELAAKLSTRITREMGASVLWLTAPHAKLSGTDNLPPKSVGIGWPEASWRIGQEGGVATTFAGNRLTVSGVPGLFTNAANGFGIAVGKKLRVSLPSFVEDPINGGYYRISAIDPSGNWLEFDQAYTWNSLPNTMEMIPWSGFTAGSYNTFLFRVDIDPENELEPPLSKAVVDYDLHGDGSVTTPALQRFLDVNDALRRMVANSDTPAALIDLEYPYLVAKAANGEDRYYAENEVVHWNSVFVDEIMEPEVDAFFRSLMGSRRAVSARGREYERVDRVFPHATANEDFADVIRHTPNNLILTYPPLSAFDRVLRPGDVWMMRGIDFLPSSERDDAGMLTRWVYETGRNPEDQPLGRGARSAWREYRNWKQGVPADPGYFDLTFPVASAWIDGVVWATKAGVGKSRQRVSFRTDGGGTSGALFTAVEGGLDDTASVMALSITGTSLRFTPHFSEGEPNSETYFWWDLTWRQEGYSF